MPVVLGIDPGSFGGLAIVNDDFTLGLLKPMPMVEVTVGKTKRRRLDQEAFYAHLNYCIEDLGVSLIVLEKTFSLHAGGGALMEHAGIIRGIIFTTRIRLERVDAATWKPKMRAPKDKKQSTQRAEEIWPLHNGRFRGPKKGTLDGIAEAAMLALYGHSHVLNRVGEQMPHNFYRG